jgi:ribosomal protein L37E
MNGFLSRLFGGSDPHLVHECRRCGASVDSETPNCPTCGHGEIRVYDVR